MSDLKSYGEKFEQVVNIIESAKERAYRKVNEELILMYRDIGEYISKQSDNAQYGDAFVQKLADFFADNYPDLKGFTRRGLYRMKQFYELYKDNEKVSPLVTQLSWTNHLKIMSACKSMDERIFYMNMCIKDHLSKRELERQIDSGYYERYMLSQKPQTPAIDESKRATGNIFLDNYVLDFLDVHDTVSEHDLQKSIIRNLKDFILEMGKDFTFLKSKKSTSIGIIIPSIANLFYPSIVRGIEDEIVSRNYHMSISSCDRDKERINYSIENMLAVNVQGIISIYIDEIPEAMFRLVKRGGVALNVVSNGICIPDMHTILVDKVEECGLAVQHLLDLGHKKVAMLFDKLDNSIQRSRLTGYKQVLGKAKIPYREEYVYIWGRDAAADVTESADKGYYLTKALLERTPEVTAFVCMNDAMALGALKAVREAGKKVPDDYSIVGFDDLVFADSVDPSLTTVGLEQYLWGKKLAQYYFSLLEHPQVKESCVSEEEVLVKSRLIVRQSTRKIDEM